MPKFIGFDATEHHRTKNGGTFDASPTCLRCSGRGMTAKAGKECSACRGTGELLYDVRYPLREWGWDRLRCQQEIAAAGLPVPVKSACFFCPASKKREIRDLPSDLYDLALDMEANYRGGKHWRGEEASTVGLGRRFCWADVCNGQPELQQLSLF